MGKIRELLMADDGLGGPSLSGFEEDDAEGTEIITLGPGESPPEGEDSDEDEGKIVLTKEEYEQLRSGRDSTNVLADGLKELKDVLGNQQREPANIQQQPGESDEEFEKRLEADLFAEGKSGKAIREAIERYGGGQVAQLMSMISEQNKQLLQLSEEDGPIFKRYKREIEQIVKELPANQQNHPKVWEYALTQVKNTHQDELVKESVNAQVERLVKERLAELGVGEEAGAQKTKKQGEYVEGGSGRGSANAGGKSSGKKRIYITETDRRIALEKGIPVEQYVKRKGVQ